MIYRIISNALARPIRHIRPCLLASQQGHVKSDDFARRRCVTMPFSRRGRRQRRERASYLLSCACYTLTCHYARWPAIISAEVSFLCARTAGFRHASFRQRRATRPRAHAEGTDSKCQPKDSFSPTNNDRQCLRWRHHDYRFSAAS